MAPANIMLADDGTWVIIIIIDLESCRLVGDGLRDTATKRTYGWHDPGVTVSSEMNDLDAFSELWVRLLGSSAEDWGLPVSVICSRAHPR
jgi:hypothetical protein